MLAVAIALVRALVVALAAAVVAVIAAAVVPVIAATLVVGSVIGSVALAMEGRVLSVLRGGGREGGMGFAAAVAATIGVLDARLGRTRGLRLTPGPAAAVVAPVRRHGRT